MVFPSVEFALFFPLVLTLSWVLMPHPRLWKPFVLVASYAFYMAASWKFGVLLAIVTLGNQLAAVVLAHVSGPRAPKWIVALAVVLDLGILGALKYYGFFARRRSTACWATSDSRSRCRWSRSRSRWASASTSFRRSATWSTSFAA